MSFRSFVTRADVIAKRVGAALLRPVAVASATYATLDKAVPAATMKMRGDPTILSEPVKIGVAVASTAAVEAGFHYLATDVDVLDSAAEAAAERYAARAEKSREAAAEKEEAAA